MSEVAARTADRVASLHHVNMEVLNIFLLKYCIVLPAELCQVRSRVAFCVLCQFSKPLKGRWTGHLGSETGEQDLQALVLFRQVDQDLLVEPPQDGRVEAPRKVGRRKEQNAAFTFALQAVKLDEKLCLAPSTGLDTKGAAFKIIPSIAVEQ